MPKIICFSGKSNSGKTTLISKVATILREMGFSVNIIKHDPKNKAEFDTQGKEHNKDSFKFSQVASRVAVISPQKSTILSSNAKDFTPDSKNAQNKGLKDISEYECYEFNKIISFFNDCDIVLIEGLKHLPYPRIVIFREQIDKSYIPYANAFALSANIIDNKQTRELLGDLPIFDLDNAKEITEFIVGLS